MQDLKEFLIKAKKNTYALSGETGEEAIVNGAKELTFEEEQFFYRDRYYGSNPFIGQEVVFYEEKPIWAMNYAGRCLDNNVSSKETYGFLKECLKNVDIKSPFRGPKKYKLDNLVYKNKSKGSIDNFFGEEAIYVKNKKVYELQYRGGSIK